MSAPVPELVQLPMQQTPNPLAQVPLADPPLLVHSSAVFRRNNHLLNFEMFATYFFFEITRLKVKIHEQML